MVTCARDLETLELQAQSINLYLTDDIEIGVIVNESSPEIGSQVRGVLSKYSRHRTRIIPRQHIISDALLDRYCGAYPQEHRGWYSQQVLKLICPARGNYGVWDSKDILIRPTSWAGIPWEFKLADVHQNHYLSLFYSRCQDRFGAISVLYPQTPRYLRRSILRRLFATFGGLEPFMKWFYESAPVFEFMAYDAVESSFRGGKTALRASKERPAECLKIWTLDQFESGNWESVVNNPSIRMLSIHNSVWRTRGFNSQKESFFNKFGLYLHKQVLAPGI